MIVKRKSPDDDRVIRTLNLRPRNAGLSPAPAGRKSSNDAACRKKRAPLRASAQNSDADETQTQQAQRGRFRNFLSGVELEMVISHAVRIVT